MLTIIIFRKFVFVFTLSMLLSAVQAGGEKINLLYTNDFHPDPFIYDRAQPEYWATWQKVTTLPEAGPHGENAMRIDFKSGWVGLPGIRVVPGEQYKIGGWLKTSAFKSEHAVFELRNYEWTRHNGTPTLPDTHGKWQKFEAQVTAPSSWDHRAIFCFVSDGFEGSVEIAAPFVEPVSPRAVAACEATIEPATMHRTHQEEIVRSAHTESAPIIDGRLDDAVWRNAFEFSDFVTHKTKLAPKAKTRVKILSDNEAIYFGIECDEPVGITDPGPTVGDALWNGDTVEIFFGAKSAERKLSQFVVGVNGCTYTGNGNHATVTLNGGTMTNTLGPWQSAVTKGDKMWRAEIRIPFTTLNWISPQAGDEIGFNITRDRVGKETVTWSKVLRSSFHEPQNFGILVLDDFSLAAQRRYGHAINATDRAEFEKACAAANEAVIRGKFAAQKKSVLLAQISTMSDFSLPFLPEEVFAGQTKISLRAAINEIKALPLAIANNSDRYQEFRVVVEAGDTRWFSHQLSEGLTGFPNVTMRQGVTMRETDAGGNPLLDPLPRMNEARTIGIPPYQAGLVWVDFNTSGMKPGKYNGRIVAIPLSEKGRLKRRNLDMEYSGNLIALPVEFEVMNISLPTEPSRITSFYSFASNPSAVACLNELGCQWFHLSTWDCVFPVGADGNLIPELPKVSRQIEFLQQECAKYGFRPKFAFTYDAYQFFTTCYPKDKHHLWPQWGKAMMELMEKHGVKAKEWWVELRDEPYTSDVPKIIRAAKIMKESVPGFPFGITTVSGRLSSPKDIEDLIPLIDHWIFHRDDFSAGKEWYKFIERVRSRGTTVGHYVCDTDVYASLSEYYRRTPWFTEYEKLAAQHIYQGVYYDYDQHQYDFKAYPYCTLYYMSFGQGIPSIRAMAVREGMTDLRYLEVIRQLATTHREAADFLKTAVRRVVTDVPHDPVMADKVRAEAADLILRLNSKPQPKGVN